MAPLRKPSGVKKKQAGRRYEKTKARAPKAKELMVCPNCALKIPGDSIYCPRCRVKIDEWRQYLRDLKQWEEQVQRASMPHVPKQPPQRYYDDKWQDINVRRRR
jgi:hypothetical protein